MRQQAGQVTGRQILWAAALLLALGAVTGAAQPDTEQTRKLALVELQSQDAATRVQACALLAQAGRPDDLPLLHARLFDDDETVRATAEAAIWSIWGRSGDAEADRLFQAGLDDMRGGNLIAAVDTFGRVIALRPDFTEAWNKRATLYFLLGEYDRSLADCDQVLRRNPQHFGVLAGYGQIWLRKGDLRRALDYFERALAINPNMPGVRDSIQTLREILARRARRFI